MSWRGAVLVAAGLGVAALLALSAQEPPCSPAAAGARRTVVVNVVDKNGEQVWGLTAGDFRGEFRGQPVKILSVAVDPPPHRVVILLDASPSMRNKKTWKLAKLAASDISRLSPSLFMPALSVFSGDTVLEVPFEQGASGVQEGLASLPDEPQVLNKLPPGTALWDAVARAGGVLGQPSPGDSLYLITDGMDTSGFDGAPRPINAAEDGGARIFVLLFPLSLDVPNYAPFLDSRHALRDLVQDTGGKSFTFDFDRQFKQKGERRFLDSLREQLYQPMAEFYLLQIELPQPPDKARSWKLEVLDPAGRKRKDLTVLYPQKLLPCPAAVPGKGNK